MTKEGIIEFIRKQKTSIISSVDEDGYQWSRALIQPRYIEGMIFILLLIHHQIWKN